MIEQKKLVRTYRFPRVAGLLLFPVLHAAASAASIGHWPLDEWEGATAADVVNGNDGANGGGLTWQTGMIGGATGSSARVGSGTPKGSN